MQEKVWFEKDRVQHLPPVELHNQIYRRVTSRGGRRIDSFTKWLESGDKNHLFELELLGLISTSLATIRSRLSTSSFFQNRYLQADSLSQ